MMTHEQKIRLGIFLSVATVVFIAVAGFFVVPKLRDPGDLYIIKFHDTSVHGLLVSSPVKYRGVEIGRVVRIEVDPEDLDSVLVEVKIRKGMTIKRDMTAVLAYVGLTGQKYVELSGGTIASENLRPHGEIPMGRGLGEKAEDIVTHIENAARRINELLAPENLKRFSAFLENVEQGSASLSEVITSRKVALENTLANFERASQDFARLTERMGPMSEDLQRLVKTLETSSQETLGNISQRFSSEELGQAIKDVRSFLDTASVSLKKVESVLLEQQAELARTFAGLGAAVDNLAKFSREIAEEPSAILRTRKEKK